MRSESNNAGCGCKTGLLRFGNGIRFGVRGGVRVSHHNYFTGQVWYFNDMRECEMELFTDLHSVEAIGYSIEVEGGSQLTVDKI